MHQHTNKDLLFYDPSTRLYKACCLSSGTNPLYYESTWLPDPPDSRSLRVTSRGNHGINKLRWLLAKYDLVDPYPTQVTKDSPQFWDLYFSQTA